MPCVHIKTTEEITEKMIDDLSVVLTAVVHDSFGVDEKWVMTLFTEKVPMRFDGKKDKLVHLDVRTMNDQAKENVDKATGAFCEIIESAFDVPGENIYINYSVTTYWGWNEVDF